MYNKITEVAYERVPGRRGTGEKNSLKGEKNGWMEGARIGEFPRGGSLQKF